MEQILDKLNISNESESYYTNMISTIITNLDDIEKYRKERAIIYSRIGIPEKLHKVIMCVSSSDKIKSSDIQFIYDKVKSISDKLNTKSNRWNNSGGCALTCQSSCQTTCQLRCQGCNNGTCHAKHCGGLI